MDILNHVSKIYYLEYLYRTNVMTLFKLWQLDKSFYPEISYILYRYRKDESVYIEPIRSGNIDVIEFLLRSKGKLNNTNIINILGKYYLNYYLPIYYIIDKYTEIIKLAIQKDHDQIINFLATAIINDNDGEWNKSRFLDVTRIIHNGDFTNEIIAAIQANNMKVLVLLAQLSTNKNFMLGVNSLAYAENDNKLNMLAYLANLSTNKDYNFAILLAAEQGRLDAIKILVPLNTGSTNYTNAISKANKLGYTEIAQYLTNAMISAASMLNKLAIRLFKMPFN